MLSCEPPLIFGLGTDGHVSNCCDSCSAVEIYIGIIVGCVPLFPTLLRQTSVAASVAKVLSSVRRKSSVRDASLAAMDNDPLEQYGYSTEVLTMVPVYRLSLGATLSNGRIGDIEHGRMDGDAVSIEGDEGMEQPHS